MTELKAVTRADVLKGREVAAPLTSELEGNLVALLVAINKLQDLWGGPFTITSGYRPAAINAAIGGAKKSAHMSCQAVDIQDSAQLISKWLQIHPEVLEECKLYMESPDATPTWCHVQIRPTIHRIFKPF